MKTDQVYRPLLMLLALSFACTLMSASRDWVAGLAPWRLACCATMKMVLGAKAAVELTSLTQIATAALLLLSLGMLGSRLWKTRRFVGGLGRASMAEPPIRLAKLVAGLGLSKHVVIFATDVPLAFCFGLLRPRIGISTGLAETLAQPELKAVLLHEDYHRRHYDPLRAILADVLAGTLFFLPVTAELHDLYLTSLELAADRHAVRFAGRPSLARALQKLLTHPRALHLSVPGIAGLNATEIRIAELLGDQESAPRLSARSLIISSVIIMLGCMLVL
jgi:Zn-dependent protease with chaperone function